MLLHALPLLIIAEALLITAAPPQIGSPDLPPFSRGTALQVAGPLPNPYPLPNTPYSLAFSAPGPNFPRPNVVACIFTVRLKMVEYMHAHGGFTPFTEPRNWPCAVDKLVFGIEPFATPVGGRPMTWHDAYEVLGAFSRKMLYDGYHGWWARIQEMNGGRIVGTAGIGPRES